MKFILSVFLCLPMCMKAQTVVTGTITHAFHANAEGKADAGSKVFVLKYEADVIPLYESVNNFLIAKNLRNLNSDVARQLGMYKDSASAVKGQRKFEEKYTGYLNMISKIKADETERLATLQKLGVENNAKYELLDKSTAKAISQAKAKGFDQKVIADANGIYSKNIQAGKYMILMISSNRVGFANSEGNGKIYAKLIDAKEGETVNVSNKFIPD